MANNLLKFSVDNAICLKKSYFQTNNRLNIFKCLKTATHFANIELMSIKPVFLSENFEAVCEILPCFGKIK